MEGQGFLSNPVEATGIVWVIGSACRGRALLVLLLITRCRCALCVSVIGLLCGLVWRLLVILCGRGILRRWVILCRLGALSGLPLCIALRGIAGLVILWLVLRWILPVIDTDLKTAVMDLLIWVLPACPHIFLGIKVTDDCDHAAFFDLGVNESFSGISVEEAGKADGMFFLFAVAFVLDEIQPYILGAGLRVDCEFRIPCGPSIKNDRS